MTPELLQWQQRWGISAQAMGELAVIGMVVPAVFEGATSEAATQSQLRLNAPKIGANLWRNNRGALPDKTGRFVRFGLGNDSPEINKVYKSGDLVGLAQVEVLPHHVGRIFGVFVNLEVKHPLWTTPNSEHDKAQLNCIQHVIKNGGIASFVTHPQHLNVLVERFKA